MQGAPAEPYAFAWSIVFPFDPGGEGEDGEPLPIGTGASFEWTPSEDLDVATCSNSPARLVLQVTDAEGFTGSRAMTIFIGEIC